jgi:hypothetical protein
MEKTKPRLLGTASDLGSISIIIGSYFYSNTPFELRKGERGVYSIHRPADKMMKNEAACFKYLFLSTPKRWMPQLSEIRSVVADCLKYY